ncbi:hypothetical protein [Haloplanus natans]|uniref:hypothetical protein n=1 Tax=Haloplanus natans TaxID=376171 RepID=UPI000677C7FB|nr:hypothetical protein [Haloplanus natans]
MDQYIEPSVSDWINQSSPEDERQFALVPKEGAAPEIESRADSYGVTVDRILPSGVILITASAGSFGEFVDTASIQSVSVTDGMTAQQ